MNSQVPPTDGGGAVGPADLSLPVTRPIDLTPLLATQSDPPPKR